jgi:hypothetical protein
VQFLQCIFLRDGLAHILAKIFEKLAHCVLFDDLHSQYFTQGSGRVVEVLHNLFLLSSTANPNMLVLTERLELGDELL